METRAPHIIVGLFVMFMAAFAVGFGLWVANTDIDKEYIEYDIFLQESVLGLYEQGTVFYLGIPVGKVTEIALAPDDPRTVQVTVRIQAEVPVNEGSVARLELQALTGVTQIQIFGGAPDAAALVPAPGADRAVIQAEASALSAFFEQTPNLVNELILAVGQIRTLFKDENMANIDATLVNLNALTSNLAGGTEDLDLLLADARTLISSFNETSIQLNALLSSGTDLMDDELKDTLAQLTITLADASATFRRVDEVIAANEGAITSFANGTLVEVSRLIMDLRQSSQSLTRLLNSIEDNPVDLLMGKDRPEYSPAGQ